MYFCAQIFYDILDTLGQTDEETQDKLKWLFLLFDCKDERFAQIIQDDEEQDDDNND